ncbi:uncharacterized protein TRIADDRAFT_60677 [Trichoplax adhaerens]|uniref:NB-ARC domain-containing protein n=1 Tax=Trichoplax adhaerens TaxID=10228 RepID=B3S930_TRIAD|nr:predicted protein [Trichoplax adhaerens]EDV20728.1 predicted protein [Trichoplax adhaerens]|eukprot:XP_002116669.1 predicted protein [Trichoplax adhaerens]
MLSDSIVEILRHYAQEFKATIPISDILIALKIHGVLGYGDINRIKELSVLDEMNDYFLGIIFDKFRDQEFYILCDILKQHNIKSVQLFGFQLERDAKGLYLIEEKSQRKSVNNIEDPVSPKSDTIQAEDIDKYGKNVSVTIETVANTLTDNEYLALDAKAASILTTNSLLSKIVRRLHHNLNGEIIQNQEYWKCINDLYSLTPFQDHEIESILYFIVNLCDFQKILDTKWLYPLARTARILIFKSYSNLKTNRINFHRLSLYIHTVLIRSQSIRHFRSIPQKILPLELLITELNIIDYQLRNISNEKLYQTEFEPFISFYCPQNPNKPSQMDRKTSKIQYQMWTLYEQLDEQKEHYAELTYLIIDTLSTMIKSSKNSSIQKQCYLSITVVDEKIQSADHEYGMQDYFFQLIDEDINSNCIQILLAKYIIDGIDILESKTTLLPSLYDCIASDLRHIRSINICMPYIDDMLKDLSYSSTVTTTSANHIMELSGLYFTALANMGNIPSVLNASEKIVTSHLQKHLLTTEMSVNHSSNVQPPLVVLLPSPNMEFVGRQDLLQLMKQNLDVNNNCSVSMVSLVGFGGAGKSTLALQYAHNHIKSRSYDVIAWIRAETLVSLQYGLVSLAIQMSQHLSHTSSTCPALHTLTSILAKFQADSPIKSSSCRSAILKINASTQEIESVVSNAIKILETFHNLKYLLVFDNAENKELVSEYFPLYGNGHIIVTSRNLSWQHQIDVSLFDRALSIEYLTSALSSKIQDLTNNAGLNALADELGDLPLALSQAANYMKQNRIVIDKFVKKLVTQKIAALQVSASALNDYTQYSQKQFMNNGSQHQLAINYQENQEQMTVYMHRRSVSTTWSMHMDIIKREDKTALLLMQIMAYLSPNDIHLALLREILQTFAEDTDDYKKEMQNIDSSLILLINYSLINGHNDTYSLHRLLQCVIRHNNQQYNLDVTILQHLFNYLDHRLTVVNRGMDGWYSGADVITHAELCYQHAAHRDSFFPMRIKILRHLCYFHVSTKNYRKAKVYVEEAMQLMDTKEVQINEKISKENSDPYLVDYYHDKALIYFCSGKIDVFPIRNTTARQRLSIALDLLLKYPSNPIDLAEVYIALASTISENKKNYQNLHQYLALAKEILDSHPIPQDVHCRYYNHTGLLHYYENNYDIAIKNWQLAVKTKSDLAAILIYGMVVR